MRLPSPPLKPLFSDTLLVPRPHPRIPSECTPTRLHVVRPHHSPRSQLGLALGSVPFILREHLSYSELAVFSLSGYPYSLKLFWSPIVDSVFFRSIGRRKSWIIPMQLIIGTTMLIISFKADELMENVSNSTLTRFRLAQVP